MCRAFDLQGTSDEPVHVGKTKLGERITLKDDHGRRSYSIKYTNCFPLVWLENTHEQKV